MSTLFFQVLGIEFGALVEGRLILEPVMARLAAERHDPHDNQELWEIVEWDRAAKGDDYWLEARNAFHAKLLSMSGTG